MSATSRMVKRGRGDARPVKRGQKLTRVKLPSGKVHEMTIGAHIPGGQWWRRQAAELAEKKIKPSS